ncbi:MAG: DUF3450 family protein [Planctomycetes bacterium]|nr:DUF3450 family protein [Planctomycetota bacterium]
MQDVCSSLALTFPLGFIALGAMTADGETPPTLDETRAVLGKWIETQQIITKERNDWQQAREVLAGRVELLSQELASLQEKSKTARESEREARDRRAELHATEIEVRAAGEHLTATVTRLEGEIRRLYKSLPEPAQVRLQPLIGRMPEDPHNTRASFPERFQNVLGILNEVNKDNTEIQTGYEVRNLTSGKPSEVRTLYVGLTQAYYVSPGGEAGIGRPGADGWTWESAPSIAGEVMTAMDILQGKHTPAFVALPTRIQ